MNDPAINKKNILKDVLYMNNMQGSLDVYIDEGSEFVSALGKIGCKRSGYGLLGVM